MLELAVQYVIHSAQIPDTCSHLGGRSYADATTETAKLKAQLLAQQGHTPVLREKKVKAGLAQLEELLLKSPVLACWWPDSETIRLLLGSGAAVSVQVQAETGAFLGVESEAVLPEAARVSAVACGVLGGRASVFAVPDEARLLAVTRQPQSVPLLGCGAKPRLSPCGEWLALPAPCRRLLADGPPGGALRTVYGVLRGERLSVAGVADRRLLPQYEVPNEALVGGPSKVLEMALANGHLYVLLESNQQMEQPAAPAISDVEVSPVRFWQGLMSAPPAVEAVETAPGASGRRSVHLVDVNESTGVLLHRRDVGPEASAVCCASSSAGADLWAYCTLDHLRLYSAPLHRLTSCPLPRPLTPALCRFHPSGLLLAVLCEPGPRLWLLDVGLNTVHLQCGPPAFYRSPHNVPGGLPLDSLMGLHSRVVEVAFDNTGTRLAMVCERGPLVTLRLRGSPFTAPASEAHTTTSDGEPPAIHALPLVAGLLREPPSAPGLTGYARRCLALLQNVHAVDVLTPCLGMVLRAAYQKGHLEVMHAFLDVFTDVYDQSNQVHRLVPLFWRYFSIALRAGFVERAAYVAHALHSAEMADVVAGAAGLFPSPALEHALLGQRSEAAQHNARKCDAIVLLADQLLAEAQPSEDEMSAALQELQAEREAFLRI